MANDIDKTSPHYKGEFGSIYEVNQKFPNGGVAGDYVEIDGWAHYWNADRGTWCVNAQRDSYWDELITGIIEKFKLFKGATYMGVAGVSTVPEKIAGVKMYYFAKAAGTYSGFGGLQLTHGINVLYTYNGTSWTATPLLEVAQELGVSTEKVMSQKAVNTALDKKADKVAMDVELGKKANTADVNTKFTEEKKRLDDELDKKFDKESVAQESGDSEELVMSQKAVSDKLSDLIKYRSNLSVLDLLDKKEFNSVIAILISNEFLCFDLKLEMTSSVPLSETERLNVFVQYRLNGKPPYYNALNKKINVTGSKLSVEFKASELNINRDYDNLVTATNVIIQGNVDSNTVVTITKFEISNNAINRFTLNKLDTDITSLKNQAKTTSDNIMNIVTLSEGLFENVDFSEYIPGDVTINSDRPNYRYYVSIPKYLLDEGDVLFLRYKSTSIKDLKLYNNKDKVIDTILFNINDDSDEFHYSSQLRIPITSDFLENTEFVSGVEVIKLFFQATASEETIYGFDKDNTFIKKRISGEKIFKDISNCIDNKTIEVKQGNGNIGRLVATIRKSFFEEVLNRVGKFAIRARFLSQYNAEKAGGLYVQASAINSITNLSFISDNKGNYITPMCYFEINKDMFGDRDSIAVFFQVESLKDTVNLYTWSILDVLDSKAYWVENRVSDIEDNSRRIQKSLELSFNGYSSMTPITVKKDGSGDFTTIQDAINSINDASVTNQYDIQVYDDFEIKDLKELYVNTGKRNTIDNPSNEVALVFTKSWVHIRGMKSDRNKLYVESPSDLAASSFQNIQVIKAQGNVIINNFHVAIKGGRYAIHQESGGRKLHPDYHAHTIYKDLIIEHRGNSSYTNGSGWTSICAQANGTTSGLKQTYVNCKWISPYKTPFYTHTNSEFDEPNEMTMINCSILCTLKNVGISDMGQYWGDIGAGQRAKIKFIGCNIARFNSTFSYGGPRGNEKTNNVRVKYGYNGGAEILGYGNSPMAVVQANKPCLTFKTVDNNKQIDVIGGTAYNLIWGNTWEKIKGTPVNEGYSVGSIRLADALKWSSNSQVFCLAYILGNCKGSPKTLIIKVDDTEYTLSFDKNYMTNDGSSYSWNTTPDISDKQIIDDINSTNPSIFKAFFNSPLQEFNTFEDCQEYGINADVNNISAGMCLKRSASGYQMWEIAKDGDKIEGVAGDMIIPIDYANGENMYGRILLANKSLFPISMFGLSTINVGSMYKASNNGRLVSTFNKDEASFIAIDSKYLKGF